MSLFFYLLAIVLGLTISAISGKKVVRLLAKYIPKLRRVSTNNGPWTTSLKIGRPDADFVTKAIIACIGLGGAPVEEAMYWNTYQDSNGNFLNSVNDYEVYFPSPPLVNSFWSLTIYNSKEFLVKNEINRYGLGDRNELKKDENGGFSIFVSFKRPEDTTNWLPAPKDSRFSLTLRCYLPTVEMINNPTGIIMPSIKVAIP